MRRLLGLIIVAVVFVALWLVRDGHSNDHHLVAVSNEPTATTSQVVPTPTASSQSALLPTHSPAAAPEADADEGDGVAIDATTAATPRDATQAARFTAYEQAATEFLTAFARPAPTTTAEQWWSSVAPLLSDVAVEEYAGVDPQSVPFTRMTGAAVIVPVDAPAGLLMVARAPTDAGYYRVEMTTGPEGIKVTRAVPEKEAAQ